MSFSNSRRRLVGILAVSLFVSAAYSQNPDAAEKPADTTKEEADAQRAGFGRLPEYDIYVPDNTLSVGIRVSGKAKVQFSGIGTISNENTPTGDLTSELTRVYDNGAVGLDQRLDANGSPIPNDGKTNNWRFDSADQVSADSTGIYMTSYSTVSDGTMVDAKSGPTPGVDIEVSRRVGGRKIKWGLQAGLGLNDINAKSTGEISASLRSLTDFYSLLGAAVPTAPYDGPVTRTDVVTNPDGSVTTIQTDITTLLSELPLDRTDTLTEGGAQINGFWQVKGAYLSARLGPWIEMPINEKIKVRASGGVSGTVIGAFMRFDERFLIPDSTEELAASDQTSTDAWGMFGGYVALEGQYWLTERSGFFAGASYEAVSGDVQLRSGERLADMNVDAGAGVRFGFTTRF